MTNDHGWTIHRFDRVTSTMDVAADFARFGAPERTVVIACEQTAGRGRSGRTWISPPSAALFCTIVVRPPVAADRLSTLPLIAGLVVAETIEQVTEQPVRLKWPNDVWLGSDAERRKVSGILVSSHLSGSKVDHALIGIGINVSGPTDALPPGATSLLAASQVEITPEAVLEGLLDHFDRVYAEFCDARGRPSLAGWTARAALLGEWVTIEDVGWEYSGVFVGVDDDGALLLEEPSSTVRKVVAGSMTRGPREAAEPGQHGGR